MARQNERRNHFFTLAATGIVVGMLYFAQPVLIPLALAMLFAFLLTPFATRLEKLGLGRLPATLLVVLVGLTIVVSLAWVTERQFADVAVRLPEFRQSIQNKFRGFLQSGSAVEKVRDEIQKTVKDIANNSTTQPNGASAQTAANDSPMSVRVISEPTSPVALAVEYLGAVVGPVVTAGIVIVFVIFILLRREDLRERMIQLLGEGHLSTTTEAMDEAATRVSRFLGAQSLINLSFGAVVALGIWTIDQFLGGSRNGLMTALMAGTLCAALRFVPYVGVWIAAALPLSIAFAAFPGNSVFFATLAMFVGLEIVSGQFIEPRLLGSSTGLSPIAVLAAALFWSWLWGPIGLLLSTPLTVLLVLMGKYVPQMEFLDVLLGEKSTLDPPMRVYQRLVAGDDDNAAKIAGEYLKEMPLEKIYGEILLPAMATAQRDWHQGRVSDEQHEFIRLSMSEMVDGLAEQSEAISPAQTKANEDKALADQPRGEENPLPAQNLPIGANLHVLCLPARDDSDEVVGRMLFQILKKRGYRVTVLSAMALASEMVDCADGQKADAVIISALPPQASAHARYLAKRLMARCGDMNVVLGLWLDKRPGNEDNANADFSRPVTTLQEALARMEQLSHQMLIKAENAEASDAPQLVAPSARI